MNEVETQQVEKKIITDNMNMERIYLKSIIPYKKNAKKHPESQIELLMKSIDENGYNDPIAIDENNEIIEGHGRHEALTRLNTDGRFDRIKIIKLSNLTEVQKKKYRIAHNSINLDTGFDNDLLNEEFESIEGAGFDLSGVGFTDLQVNQMRDRILVDEHSRSYSDKNKEIDINDLESGLHQRCPKCGFRFEGENVQI